MSTQKFIFFNDKFANDEQQFPLYIGTEMVTAGGILSDWLLRSITIIPYIRKFPSRLNAVKLL